MNFLCRIEVRYNMKIKIKPSSIQHPAHGAVCSALAQHDDLIVLWGLTDSRTRLCCENSVNHIIGELKGYAKMFYCDEISDHEALIAKVLKELRIESFKEFTDHMPSFDARHPTWLVFESVDHLLPVPFFEHIIRQSRESGKFKLLVTTHSADNAIHLLAKCNATVVKPIDCCHWGEERGGRVGCPREYRRQSEV